MLSVMCGRATYKLTWEEIVALYRLTLGPPPHNFQPRFNVCPTTTIDAIVAPDGKRELMRARWGLVPSRWSKPLREMKLATFNARAETLAEKPMFRSAFKRNRCLIPVSGYYEWQDTPDGKQPWYFTARDGSPALTIAGLWDEWQDKERLAFTRLRRRCAFWRPWPKGRRPSMGCGVVQLNEYFKNPVRQHLSICTLDRKIKSMAGATLHDA
jgi:putative SOS response-associated peptidase YedK